MITPAMPVNDDGSMSYTTPWDTILSEDCVAGLVQTKGFGSSLCSSDIAVDGGLKIDDGFEDAAADTPVGSGPRRTPRRR